MQSVLNEVLYHTKIDGNKLTFRQFINWFLIPDDVIITDDYEQFILSLIENNSYCVEDAMITVLSNQKYKIEEFANSRQKIVYDCINLGKQFAHHFNKIMDEGTDSQYFNHHCDELQNFFSHVNSLKFKHNNRRLTTEDLIDYFFTAGQNIEDVVKEQYIDTYDNFITYLIANRDNYDIKKKLIELINNVKLLSKEESKMIKVSESKEQSRGVFWLINDEIFAFPFYDGVKDGISKSGLTLNHKRLWNAMKSNNTMKLNNNVPYNYYPRGRVDFDNKNRPVVYMNPNIGQEYIAKIQKEFGLRETPRIIYDNSEHYKCYLDDGWKPDRSK